MKRSVVALGLLGLVCGLALPAANAAVLLQDDFSTAPFKGVNGVYIQGSNPQAVADATAPLFTVDTNEDDRQFRWLDGGDGSGTTADADPDANPTYEGLLLTGDPKWADVAIQARMCCLDQDTGMMALVLRATPKTRPTDPDSWYEFRYTTGNSSVLQSEDASGIAPPDGNPNVRLMKVVNGKWKLLAETDNDQQSKVHIPEVNAGGADHDSAGDGSGTLTGAVFRFVAKGSLLQAFILSKDGKQFNKILEATDGDLKAGLVGFSEYDYHALFDDLLVEDAP
jgi:hypothetical protein